ncbi:carbohydrate ABC transporter membrane protein 1 (CUT1 family) [Hydrogenispora ethanolica]|jgi:ABC-type sugar transport system permease subunit|uniref:Carbohydrate ABC transporter membrane protein 1 (CUT1 family) n=1 Tax=Hydrogenispora ethanolica TaxID=1082276 RepID=A0A4R1RZY9_HYDET|nr:sugar ABC transporter permease [Hydrogenispora ethanolica]TCL72381.1 carbohydrate ABC transporter membrane protein 1 (CUT1 family) [Hydrogenispora ethanolica]
MRRKSFNRREKLQYLSLVLPGLLLFTIGLILPMFLSFSYSLTSWDGMSAAKPFIGFKNYARFFTDPFAGQAWIFTFKFTFWNTIIQNVFALLFAIALNSAIKGKKIYRTVFFIPCLISAIIVGFIWLRMFINILPALNRFLGTNINFLLFGSGKTVLAGLLLANNWQWIGYWMLIYLAALQSIPGELYEAANIDGATTLGKFRHITIPLLAPAFTICIVGITTGSLKVYELLVTSTWGGPGRASTSIIYYIYNTAISGRQYGYGSAMSIVLVLVLFLVALVQLGFLRKKEVQL